MRILNILFVILCSLNLYSSDITLELKWKNQFQFAGFYIAKEKGYYKQSGLNVKINEFQDIDVVKKVLDDELVFGICDSKLILDKLKGRPISALFTVFQESPLVLATLKDSGLQNPTDLENKKIEVSSSFNQTIPSYSMLKAYKIDFEKKEPSFNVENLISRKSDAISIYESNEVYELIKRGIDYNIISPKDYGYDFYGDIVFTSSETLRDHPSDVNSFVEASILGWKYAFSNIDETVDLIYSKYNTQNKTKEELLFEAKKLLTLAGDLNKFGELNINKVKNIASIFSTLYPSKYDLLNLHDFIYENNPLYLDDYHPDIVSLTNEEKVFLDSKNHTFNVCTQNSLYPLSGVSNGKISGVLGEIYDKISRKLEVDFRAINIKNLDEMNEKISSNECDLVGVVEKWQKLFPNVQSSIVLKNLKFTVIGKNDVNFNKNDTSKYKFFVNFKRYKDIFELYYPKMEIVFEPNKEKIVKSLMKDQNNLFLTPLEVSKYFLIQNNKYKFKIIDFYNDVNYNMAIGINQNNPLMLGIINKSIDSLGIKNIENILNNYLLYVNNKSYNDNLDKKDLLNFEEITYLKNTKFNIYYNDWEPFSSHNHKYNREKGLSYDYVNEILKNYEYNFDYKYIEKFSEILNILKFDSNGVILSSTFDENKLNYASFTIPYESYPLAVAVRSDENFIYDFRMLEGKKIAIVKDFSFYSKLKDKYPDIKFIFTNDSLEALELVQNSEVFGTIDVFPVLNNYIRKYALSNLKIGGFGKERFDLQIMVNKENQQLVTILNKLIGKLDDEKRELLSNKWLTVQNESQVNYKVLYGLLILFIILFVMMSYRQIIVDKSRKLIRKEKNRYENLMENASDGIHILDNNGNVIDCNKAFAQTLGYSLTEAKMLNVRDWESIIPPESVDSLIAELIVKPATFATRFKRKDGTFLDVEVNAKGIVLDGENLLYASSRDISDVKKANEKIEQLNKKLNEANKNLEEKIRNAVLENSKQQALMVHQNRLAQLGEMVSMIAHQWRQPLSAVSIWTSNLTMLVKSGKYTNDDINDIELKIKEILTHLSKTIDEFKNYYKTENNKTQFNIKDCLHDIELIIGSLLRKNSIEFELISNDIKVYGYDNLLKQVIVALITNAVDALGDKEKSKISIKSELQDNNVLIFIQDNAGGIPLEIQDKVFDPYFSTKSDLNGTGLGLYMSKMILEKSFDGSISFESSDKGTTFKLEFPLEKA